jgi:hypothetical protein
VDWVLLGAGLGAVDGALTNVKFLVGRLGRSVAVSAIQPLPTQPDCLALSGWMGSSRWVLVGITLEKGRATVKLPPISR